MPKKKLSLLITVLCAAVLGLMPGTAQAHGNIAAVVGDSFISGEGGTETGPYLAGSDTSTNQCHRSASAPVSILGQFRPMQVQSVACSGATTDNVVSTGQYTEAPQSLEINRYARTVYVMVGGNDMGFSTVLGCYLQTECPASVSDGALQFIATQLSAKLDKAYAAVRNAAPYASIKVVLYPRLLPGNGEPTANCPELSSSEIAKGNQIQDALNAKVSQRALARGFRVVGTSAGFAEHDVCAQTPFFYRPGTVPGPATYHPNLPGRLAMASALSGSAI